MRSGLTSLVRIAGRWEKQPNILCWPMIGCLPACKRRWPLPPNPDWETKTRGKTEFLEKVMVDRSHKAQAPEAIQPQSKLSRDEVIQRYKEGRARAIKFIEETQVPLKEHTADHPFPVFGTLNAYQWLIYIPLHNMRHDQQIAEVKASAGFP